MIFFQYPTLHGKRVPMHGDSRAFEWRKFWELTDFSCFFWCTCRSCLGREIVISNALHCPGTMMAMSTLPDLAGISCQSRCSPAVARIQYGLPRRQITRVRALATSSSLKTTLTPSKLSFNPFRPGESLGVSCSPKAVPVRRRAPVQRISAQAADASASDGGESEETAKVGDVAIPKPAMGRLKIGIYFATWWALNVVFNIYNKKVLNAYPFPWLTSTLSLLAGSTIMILSWVLRIVPAPDVDADFWKGLAPVCHRPMFSFLLRECDFVTATFISI